MTGASQQPAHWTTWSISKTVAFCPPLKYSYNQHKHGYEKKVAEDMEEAKKLLNFMPAQLTKAVTQQEGRLWLIYIFEKDKKIEELYMEGGSHEDVRKNRVKIWF